MGADYSFYVKFIATRAPTFFGYIISVLASVNTLKIANVTLLQDIVFEIVLDHHKNLFQ